MSQHARRSVVYMKGKTSAPACIIDRSWLKDSRAHWYSRKIRCQRWLKAQGKTMYIHWNAQVQSSNRRRSVTKAEHTAASAYAKVEAMAQKANTDSRKAEVAAAWKAMAERFPETRHGKKAAKQ